MRRLRVALAASALLAVVILVGLFGNRLTRAAPTNVSYWLWDAQQKPAYEQCASAFTAKHPGIVVRISQVGWNDYWTSLAARFASGTAPDVFVNHLAQAPGLAATGGLVDLAPLIAKDRVALDRYAPGLVSMWQRDGKAYGLPKDWDTVALIYNADALRAASVTAQQLRGATWNPKDGGSFEKLLAQLTVDEKGTRGDQPGFDRSRVKRYGLLLDGASLDAFGQTTWSGFAAANGFKYAGGPVVAQYNYDDPKLVEALRWLVELSRKGYSASADVTRIAGVTTMFQQGKGAVVVDGSWMITTYTSQKQFEVGFAPLPEGPAGRKSMLNAVADSIWSGSKVQKEAWEWVKFLGTPECQDIVAGQGVAFPALSASTGKMKDVYAKRGIDVSAFLESATPEASFPFPVMEHAAEVKATMKTALEYIFFAYVDPMIVLDGANKTLNEKAR